MATDKSERQRCDVHTEQIRQLENRMKHMEQSFEQLREAVATRLPLWATMLIALLSSAVTGLTITLMK